MDQHKIIPFYMSYPMPLFFEKEDEMIKDLEYLQQMYPKEIKHYHKVVVSVLDKLDYKNSMIYDEYPDKILLYKLSIDIVEVIKSQEENKIVIQHEEEKWKWVNSIVQVLLFHEIYKRRHDNNRGILKF